MFQWLCIIALLTLSIYCIENTSVIAAAQATLGTPTTQKTLAVLLVVRVGVAWSSNIKAER